MRAALENLIVGEPAKRPENAPEAELVLAPASQAEVGQILELASEVGLSVLVWGGGSHQGYGARFQPDILLLTEHLNELVVWEPDDLTVVVGAGMLVGQLESLLAERRQTAILPEVSARMTVGGVVAAGISGWRRARYGPTRDRILEVDFTTGDGRAIRGGGRVVKNVTGYDLPRLVTGSLGALGVITQVCLKLWPLPEATVTVSVPSASAAQRSTYRPLAILEGSFGTRVYLGGRRSEVESQAATLGGEVNVGLVWPDEIENTGDAALWSLRVPPGRVAEAVSLVPDGWGFLAQHGVGIVELVDPRAETHDAMSLRHWAEGHGGSLVMVDAPTSVRDVMDPWGTPPGSTRIQRDIVARFDPARVVNPGRLPGGI